MSDIIQLLPDSVANQIAAGEVIQRPASVIKELVENAVDAGAKNINVLVVDAGRTSIQVIDDGKGMSETDARLSFERHATSKIRSAEDLFSLHTMGFRGEALASIAAVAQIELKTRQASDEIGTLLSISGSKFTGQEPCSCPVGSNFSIENLFYNVPARRKFLKSNSTELNNIITAFERIALVYPDISFTLHSNGTEMFNLKAGVLRQRIIDVFGKRLNQDLLSVKVDTSMCKISGYVGKPESARKKGAHQYFFVNGRYMKHPYFSKAVMNAFDRLVPMGEQVPYFIYFDINTEDIDVNIHPTKTEIKFENEQAIWQILSASVKEAVGMFNDVPSIDFDTQGRPDIPVYNPENNVSAPKVQFNPTYNPFNTGGSAQPQTKSADKWESLYNGLKNQTSQETELFTSKMAPPTQEVDDTPMENVIAEKSPAHYQYKGCYIMTAVKSGLMIVDQHRAHVRILYDKYLEQMKNREVSSQKVLFPESFHLSATEDVTLNKIEPEMIKLGFEITALGGGAMAINAIPAGIEGLNVVELVHNIIVSAQEKAGDINDETNSALALTLARNAAIPFGQVLSNDEMENIFNSLFASSNPNYTPDGKNILCILKQNEIEHLLG
ncbi:DNA mismatch repair endonuclease MutL [Segatella paludivivens]|uniref:DNA mismatch repair endonuclease MutL n=1 Tax=Segatella paludivivens TaxID=185294 RepID=UPI00046F98BD|nr:DNA mismatch repair endonuclease MutL [Segatella paludivivens]